MTPAVPVCIQERQSSMTAVFYLKRELLTPSFAMYNDSTYFQVASVLTKTSLAKVIDINTSGLLTRLQKALSKMTEI